MRHILKSARSRYWRSAREVPRWRLAQGAGALSIALLVVIALACGGEPEANPASLRGDIGPTPTIESPTAAAATPLLPTPAVAGTSLPAGLVQALVVRVIDGDTIEADIALDGRATIRYIGIDSPESVDRTQPVACFSSEATAGNTALVLGKTVYLERDKSETDRFNRLLRYVYLPGGEMVNERLVLDGFAEAIAYPPDVKYQLRFDTAEREARAANRGLWGACSRAVTPAATPRPGAPPPAPPSDGQPPLLTGTAPAALGPGCPQGCTSQTPGCNIKGNINSEGVKIFHVPSGEFYSQTVITVNAGERWFCTAEEAQANGWRASQR